MTTETSSPVTDRLPALPDDDADFTPDLARKIIAKYQELLRHAQSTRDDGLEQAALYHDQCAADCRAIAAVNQDNHLGPSCETHAIDHEIAADDIRAMKGSPVTSTVQHPVEKVERRQ